MKSVLFLHEYEYVKDSNVSVQWVWQKLPPVELRGMMAKLVAGLCAHVECM